MSQDSLARFPPDFIWGVATSAYQIEGAWNETGKGPSIWDTFTRKPGKIFKDQNGEIAVDHYHRYREDIQIMADLGIPTYRFSVAWPRVQPDGQGMINETGLDFYDRLVDAILEKSIRPYLTLYHYDLPQALQDLGGWPSRDTAYRFADYAGLVARRLGDRVSNWITLNEPQVSAMAGYFFGEHAPGVQNPIAALQAGYHLLLAHGLAVEALRTSLTPGAQIGIALNLNPVYPASDTEEDRQAAFRTDVVINRTFLEPLMTGHFPQAVETLFGPFFPEQQPEDMQRIGAPLDFLGINYYSRVVMRHDPDFPIINASQVFPDGNEYSQMWEIYPEGLYQLLQWVWKDYQPAHILISENGVPVADGLDLDERVRDYRRIRYLRDHLIQVHRLIQDGIPVEGYFVWSLMDNFEWAHGYSKRFGIVYVDFDSLERRVKDSGAWYAQLIRENGFDPKLTAFLPT
jgi:beta-glucosidase